MMRSLKAWVLIVCFAVPYLATYLWLRYEKHLVKREVKAVLFQTLAPEECTVFRFTTAEELALDWEHATEFSWKGQKYDVVKRVNTPTDTTIYYCWKDVKESALDQQIAATVQGFLGGNPEKDRTHQAVSHLLKVLPEKSLLSIIAPTYVENFPEMGGWYIPLQSETPVYPFTPPPETMMS